MFAGVALVGVYVAGLVTGVMVVKRWPWLLKLIPGGK